MNIFVGNLPWSLSEADLRKAFEEHGTVDTAKIIMDRETGRSRGFGFVEMPVLNDALKAMRALNDSTLGGRKIVVNEARPRNRR